MLWQLPSSVVLEPTSQNAARHGVEEQQFLPRLEGRPAKALSEQVQGLQLHLLDTFRPWHIQLG